MPPLPGLKTRPRILPRTLFAWPDCGILAFQGIIDPNGVMSHLRPIIPIVVGLCLAGLCCVAAASAADNTSPRWLQQSIARSEQALVQRHGEAQRPRIERGLGQVGPFWRDSDGDASAFEAFVQANFAGDPATLDALFSRFQRRLEVLDGSMVELTYEFKLHTDLDRGPILPFDEVFSAYDPSAHVNDDLFNNRLAFVVLLNFPLTTLEQRLADGEKWSRRQWAEVRLAQRFSRRIPADVLLAASEAQSRAEIYINEYNIWMHHLLDGAGQRLFPAGMKLITHWNLRDEIKAQYSAGASALPRQRMIQRVMERIIDQSIPQVVINNPGVDWNPATNQVEKSAVDDSGFGFRVSGIGKSEFPKPDTRNPIPDAEPDTRYARLLAVFQAQRRIDPYSPNEPTLIARRFEGDRQMSEKRVRAMLEQVLTAPQFAQTAALIARRLDRPLEPFDIWYDGFRPRGSYTEAQLDEIVRKRYPTAEAFQADLPNILQKLDFSAQQAQFLQQNIQVQPSRGTGHAMGGAMRGQKARLRTRVEKDGMNYKGFNIAMHEMGHNIEQTFSLNRVDYTLLAGVPNNAFTEALAMASQGHDLEVLGLSNPDAKSQALMALSDYWQTAEIAGVALVDMAVWHWMYDHPDATPAQLKAATLVIAKETWNRYFAPAFGQKDVTLLAVYSHMIRDVLYLPDYPIGHLIQCQVERKLRKISGFGAEFERMARFGNLTPDLWMKNATGTPVGAEAMLEAAEEALKAL
jgi:hypothetical protein